MIKLLASVPIEKYDISDNPSAGTNIYLYKDVQEKYFSQKYFVSIVIKDGSLKGEHAIISHRKLINRDVCFSLGNESGMHVDKEIFPAQELTIV